MKAAFTALPERVVTLTRDTEEVDADGKPVETTISLTVRPYPAGYPQFVVAAYPAPTSYVNGEPVEVKAEANQHVFRTNAIILAKCLGDQLDAKPPTGNAARPAWDAYAVAVITEFSAANFVQGDIDALLQAMYLVNRGAGRLGKANS